MSMAIAPRRPRGRWRVALALALLAPALALPASRAQGPAAKDDPKARPKDDAKAKDAPKDEEPPRVDRSGDAPDRYEDPRAADALRNNFPELPSVLPSAADKTLVDQLARGQGNLDLQAIDRFVRSRAAILTSRNNLKALADPAGNPSAAKNIENATTDLLGPFLQPPAPANAGFRRRYTDKLVEVFKPIWAGNLHSRTMAMIVLSQSGEPSAMPVFTAQLNDPNQLAVVKLRCAIGISNVALNGRRDLGGDVALPAAKALSDFLIREPEVFWYIQFRALEALGSLRQATERPLGGKAEFADTAMGLLTNPKVVPSVRAWAAWSLGWMRVPGSVRNFNFALVAHAAGQAAVDLGDKIAAIPVGSLPKVIRLTDVLVQLNQAFIGDPEIRESGLLHASHPAAGGAMGYVSDVARRVQAVTRDALELSGAVGAQVEGRRKALAAAVEDLRSFLAKPPAGGKTLYAGGPEFPDPAPPKVAAGARP